MNSFDQIDELTNLHKEALKNINLDVLNNTYAASLKGLIPDTIKAFDTGTFNDYSNTLKKLIPDFINRYDSNVTSIYADTIRKLVPDFIRAYDTNAVNTYATTLKNIDLGLFSNINFDSINHINSAIKQTVNDLVEKTEFDDSDYKRVNDISNYALEMTFSNNLPTIVKKNILLNIISNLWKLMGIQQFSFLLAIIAIILPFLQPSSKPHNIIMKETIREIYIIKSEQKELFLRGVIRDGTAIHRKPNTKSTTIFALDCGDIVEVLKVNKKWVYIRLYKTDIEGWVLKKYTKGTRR